MADLRDAPLPYQPNPGLPGYNPNPGDTPGAGAVIGRDPTVEENTDRKIIGYHHDPISGSDTPVYDKPKFVPQPLVQIPKAPEGLPPAKPGEIGPPPPPGLAYASPPEQKPAPAVGASSEDSSDALLKALLAPSGSTKPIPAHEVELTSKKRQSDEQAAIEQEKTAEDALAQARAGRNAALAGGNQKLSDAAYEAKVDTQNRAFDAKKANDAYMAKLDDFSKQLAEDRIDPERRWNNASTGRKITWSIAKAFGAIQQGLLHLPTNQIADQLDEEVRRDIDAQKENHKIKRQRFEDLNTFYGHAIAQTKNADAAAVLAHGYGLEAIKAEIQALADAADTPIAQAEADKMKAALTEKQVQRGMAENRWLQATSGGAGGLLTDKDRKALAMELLKEQIHERAEERKEQRKADLKRGDEVKGIQTTIDEQDRQFDNLLKHPAIDKLGAGPGVASALGGVGQRVMPESAITKVQADGINQLMLGAVGKQLKDTEGRISPPVLEGLHKLEIQPGDTPDVAREKIRQAKAFVDEAARQGGATAPEANRPPGSGFTPAGGRAKGGHTKKDVPYLVGEEGPELVVPKKDGFVLTALQTAALRGAPPTEQQMDAVRRFHARAFGGPMLGPGSGGGEATSYALKGGGLDVMGSFQKINEENSQAMNHPMAAGSYADGGTMPGATDHDGEAGAESYMPDKDGEAGAESSLPESAKKADRAKKIGSFGDTLSGASERMTKSATETSPGALTVRPLAEGGAMNEQKELTEEDAAKFMGLTPEQLKAEAEANRQARSYEAASKLIDDNRRGEEIQRKADEEARQRAVDERRAQDKAEEEAKVAQLDPVRRWAYRLGQRAASSATPDEKDARELSARQWITEKGQQAEQAAKEYLPEWYRKPTTELLDRVNPAGGHRNESGAVPLYEPPGQELHQSPEGHAFYASAAREEPAYEGSVPRASLSGRASVSRSAPAESASSPPPKPKPRKMTPEEMNAAADKLLAEKRVEYDRSLARPPAVQGALDRSEARKDGGPVKAGIASALAPRLQESEPAKMMDSIGSGISYHYRPEVGEDERKRFGTTTQDLRKTEMGDSIVRKDPSGYDAIDTREAVGPVLASLGNLNQRLRALEGSGKNKRRG